MIFIRLAATEVGTKKLNTIALLLLCKLRLGKEGIRSPVLGNDDEAKYNRFIENYCYHNTCIYVF